MPDAPVADMATLERGLLAIGGITYAERDLSLFNPFKEDILKALNEYLSKNRDFRQFVAAPELVEDVQQVCIDAPRNGLWKDSDTVDWKQTPTGIGTFDNVFPESASAALQYSSPPAHWAMLFGLVEIGSANNILNVNLARVNGKPRGVFALQNQVRLALLKARRLAKGLLFKDRGDLNLDVEFETTATTETYPLAVHILPGEIAKATAVAGYVTTIAA